MIDVCKQRLTEMVVVVVVVFFFFCCCKLVLVLEMARVLSALLRARWTFASQVVLLVITTGMAAIWSCSTYPLPSHAGCVALSLSFPFSGCLSLQRAPVQGLGIFFGGISTCSSSPLSSRLPPRGGKNC